jgi:hypothetical protein
MGRRWAWAVVSVALVGGCCTEDWTTFFEPGGPPPDAGDGPALERAPLLAFVADSTTLQTHLGSTSPPLLVRLVNRGNSDAKAVTISIAGGDGRFDQTNDCGPLRPDQMCSLHVTFTPSRTGTERASIVATAENAQTTGLPIAGIALFARLTIDRPAATFGPLTAPMARENGFPSAGPITFIVGNDGNAATGPLDVTLTAPFQFAPGPGCHGRTLASSETCRMDVNFVPPTGGTFEGALLVTGIPGGTVTGKLTGVATYQLTLNLVPAPSCPAPASGSVSITPGATVCNIGGGQSCRTVHEAGSQVVLTATVMNKPGSLTTTRFVGFVGDCVSPPMVVPTCTLTMNTHKVVTARFCTDEPVVP